MNATSINARSKSSALESIWIILGGSFLVCALFVMLAFAEIRDSNNLIVRSLRWALYPAKALLNSLTYLSWESFFVGAVGGFCLYFIASCWRSPHAFWNLFSIAFVALYILFGKWHQELTQKLREEYNGE